MLDRNYPHKCRSCGWLLCFIDRTYDNCPMCDEPIPEQLKLDFDFRAMAP